MPLGMKSTATPIVAMMATKTTARNATVELMPVVELVERIVRASRPTIAQRMRATEMDTTLEPSLAILVARGFFRRTIKALSHVQRDPYPSIPL